MKEMASLSIIERLRWREAWRWLRKKSYYPRDNQTCHSSFCHALFRRAEGHDSCDTRVNAYTLHWACNWRYKKTSIFTAKVRLYFFPHFSRTRFPLKSVFCLSSWQNMAKHGKTHKTRYRSHASRKALQGRIKWRVPQWLWQLNKGSS